MRVFEKSLKCPWILLKLACLNPTLVILQSWASVNFACSKIFVYTYAYIEIMNRFCLYILFFDEKIFSRRHGNADTMKM